MFCAQHLCGPDVENGRGTLIFVTRRSEGTERRNRLNASHHLDINTRTFRNRRRIPAWGISRCRRSGFADFEVCLAFDVVEPVP